MFVEVKPHVLTSQLIAHICEKYGLTGNYALYVEDHVNGSRQQVPLDSSYTLAGNGVNNTFVYHLRPKQNRDSCWWDLQFRERQRLPDVPKVSLTSVESKEVFVLKWQPAVIGRKDTADSDANIFLAVDLSFENHGLSVSRRHACIIYRSNQFAVEVLSSRNQTFLNGNRILASERHSLHAGDLLQLGSVKLQFEQYGD